MHDPKLVAVVFALKIWRHYLYRETFEVFALSIVTERTEYDIKEMLELLKNYDFTLLYHPGKANVALMHLVEKQLEPTSNLEGRMTVSRTVT